MSEDQAPTDAFDTRSARHKGLRHPEPSGVARAAQQGHEGIERIAGCDLHFTAIGSAPEIHRRLYRMSDEVSGVDTGLRCPDYRCRVWVEVAERVQSVAVGKRRRIDMQRQRPRAGPPAASILDPNSEVAR